MFELRAAFEGISDIKGAWSATSHFMKAGLEVRRLADTPPAQSVGF
jgi:hypothetical protein